MRASCFLRLAAHVPTAEHAGRKVFHSVIEVARVARFFIERHMRAMRAMRVSRVRVMSGNRATRATQVCFVQCLQ